jgi:hypothetical protein
MAVLQSSRRLKGRGLAYGGSGSNIVGTRPDDVLSDDLGTLVSEGQPRSGLRALLKSGHASASFSRPPPSSSRPTYRRGLELTRMSLGETVIGGLPEDARSG